MRCLKSSEFSSHQQLTNSSPETTMATLNLPKPVNTYAGEDELRTRTNGAAANGNAATNGTEEVGEDIGEYKPPRPSDRYKVGIIYPPREVRCEYSSLVPTSVLEPLIAMSSHAARSNIADSSQLSLTRPRPICPKSQTLNSSKRRSEKT